MSLLEATVRTISHPIGDTVEEFPKLSYADKAQILRSALKRARASELETLSAVGITGEAALPHLKPLDKQFQGDLAFINHVNSNVPDQGFGVHDVFTFVLKKKFPQAASDQLALAAEAVPYQDKFQVVMRTCGLEPKQPSSTTAEENGGESPLTERGNGNSPSTASGEKTATV